VVAIQDERSQHKNKAKALKVLQGRLMQLELERAHNDVRTLRNTKIGTGARSDKIRTFNAAQNRVTDHRIGLTVHDLQRVLSGELLHRFTWALWEAAVLSHENTL
jgi:peptide chain release factor 1